MAEGSEDEKQALDDALSTLDDLYTRPRSCLMTVFATSKWKPSRSWLKKRRVACCPCWIRKCSTRFGTTTPKKMGREARVVRTRTFLDENPQKLTGLGAA